MHMYTRRYCTYTNILILQPTASEVLHALRAIVLNRKETLKGACMYAHVCAHTHVHSNASL